MIKTLLPSKGHSEDALVLPIIGPNRSTSNNVWVPVTDPGDERGQTPSELRLGVYSFKDFKARIFYIVFLSHCTKTKRAKDPINNTIIDCRSGIAVRCLIFFC